jgi:hypothetical protein
MTVSIITTIKDNTNGTSLSFDAKSDYGSPTQSELNLLSEHLTPKGLDLLQQILAKQLEQFGAKMP